MRPRDRAAAAVAILALVFAALAIGSAPRWAICAGAALAIASSLPYLRSSRSATSTSPLLVFLGLAAAFTALQLIPLPALLVGQLSPAKLALLRDNAAALGESPPAFLSLSMDPAATLVELAKLTGYLAFAWTALRVATSSRGRRWLMVAVAGTGLAVAVCAVLHHVVGASKLFGLYTPKLMAAPPYMAPFLNPNHLASFLGFSVPIALGLGFGAAGTRRLAWFGVAGGCAGVSFLVRSRAGVVSLAVGLLAFALLHWLQRRRAGEPGSSETRRSTVIALGVVGGCAVVLLGALTAGGVLGNLAATPGAELAGDEGKFITWKPTAELIADHPLTGVGRGAFEPAFTRFEVSSDTFSHVENEYLQAAVDWGLPAAGLLAIALVMVVLAAARRVHTSPLEAGAAGAVVTLAVHNVADFSLSLPGVALPGIAALAVLSWVDVRRRRGTGPARRARDPYLRGALAVVGLAVIGLAASPAARVARDETRAFRSQRDHRDPADNLAAARATFARHPSDFLAAGQLGWALFELRDPRAVAVVNRALSMKPESSSLHLMAARMLAASSHPEQALVEYALALRQASGSAAILGELTRRFPEAHDAVRGLPRAAETLERTTRGLLALERADVALLHVSRFVEANPDHAAARRLLALVAERHGNLDLAVASAERAHELDPSPEGALALARAYRAGDQTDAARATIQAALAGPPRPSTAERVDLLLVLAGVEGDAGNFAVARDTLLTVQAMVATDRRASARVHRLLAGVEARLGNAHQAELERARAEEIERR